MMITEVLLMLVY